MSAPSQSWTIDLQAMRLRGLWFLMAAMPLWASGQTPATWFDLGGSLGLPGPFEASVELAHRRENGFTDNSFAEASFSWKANKHWDFSLGYRYFAEGPLNGVDHLGHRYQFDAAFDDKIGEVKIKVRLRQQFKHTDVLSSENGRSADRTSRLKLSGSFDIRKDWDGELGGELFLPNTPGAPWHLDEYRLFASLEHELNKWADLQVKWVWDAPWAAPSDEGTAIVNVGLKLDIDKAAKKWRKIPFRP